MRAHEHKIQRRRPEDLVRHRVAETADVGAMDTSAAVKIRANLFSGHGDETLAGMGASSAWGDVMNKDWLFLYGDQMNAKAPTQRRQGSLIKNWMVILRRSDARRAKVAGIAQPKNPVSTRRTSRQFAPCFLVWFAVLHLTGSFTARRPAAFAHAAAPFRMTPIFFDA